MLGVGGGGVGGGTGGVCVALGFTWCLLESLVFLAIFSDFPARLKSFFDLASLCMIFKFCCPPLLLPESAMCSLGNFGIVWDAHITLLLVGGQ